MPRLDLQAAGKSARKGVGGWRRGLSGAAMRHPVRGGQRVTRSAPSMTPMSALSPESREFPCRSTESTRLTFSLTSSCGTTREPLQVCRRRAVWSLGSSIENF